VLRRLRPADDAVHRRQQDLHHPGDDGQREAARAWFLAQGGTDIGRHFVATTTNVGRRPPQFGITTTFGFWDWVGGRYSLWSAIGLPIAIAMGAENFRALLAGAHAMDRHFAEAPLAPTCRCSWACWTSGTATSTGFTSRSVAPYHQGLKRLPAYLQQLEMESNGKCVDLDGEPLPFGTSPVVWGEPGTNGQHAYFQMLHQGTDVIPVEFILVKTGRHPALPDLHQHQAAGQRPGAEPGADAGQEHRGRRWREGAHRVEADAGTR
jgi:glucose-6-phosphate isomerase